MLTPLIVAALAVAAPVQEQDTTIAVPEGTRLEVTIFRGELEVRTWDRNEVRVVAERDDRRRDRVLDIDRSASVLRIRAGTDWAHREEIEAYVTIPSWMSIEIDGNHLDVDARVGEGGVTVGTVNGDIAVRGGTEYARLHTVTGDIEVRGSRGRIEIVGVNGDVELADIDGDIDVETVNGEVVMRGIESGRISASSVNGEVEYDGTIRDGGSYILASHNGEVTITIPERASATVSVSTYQGALESDFPIQLTGTTRGKQLDFTLGDGSARIELESFNGTVRLVRPRR